MNIKKTQSIDDIFTLGDIKSDLIMMWDIYSDFICLEYHYGMLQDIKPKSLMPDGFEKIKNIPMTIGYQKKISIVGKIQHNCDTDELMFYAYWFKNQDTHTPLDNKTMAFGVLETMGFENIGYCKISKDSRTKTVLHTTEEQLKKGKFLSDLINQFARLGIDNGIDPTGILIFNNNNDKKYQDGLLFEIKLKEKEI